LKAAAVLEPRLFLLEIKNLVLWVRSSFAGLAGRRGLRHKVQGARHKERIGFLLLFLPCALSLEPFPLAGAKPGSLIQKKRETWSTCMEAESVEGCLSIAIQP
jgi:hypothetical protein